MARVSESSPYVEFDRKQWRTLRKATPLVLTEEELQGMRGLGEQIDLDEVAEVYLPLSRLIHLQVSACSPRPRPSSGRSTRIVRCRS
jgi:type I pantothenate kinase